MSATKSTRPTYRLGETVIYDGRVSMVASVSKKYPDIITVASYAGDFMISTDNPKLSRAE